LRQPITLMQLSQMAVGVYVTYLAWGYQSSEKECSRSYTDSGFFLFCGVMYLSYFLLFLKLYIDNYVLRKAKPARESTAAKKRAEKKE
jgi:hypothetical protein